MYNNGSRKFSRRLIGSSLLEQSSYFNEITKVLMIVILQKLFPGKYFTVEVIKSETVFNRVIKETFGNLYILKTHKT